MSRLGLEPPRWCQPPNESCDGDCSDCSRENCEERGAECAAPENCEDCPKRETCKAAKMETTEEGVEE